MNRLFAGILSAGLLLVTLTGCGPEPSEGPHNKPGHSTIGVGEPLSPTCTKEGGGDSPRSMKVLCPSHTIHFWVEKGKLKRDDKDAVPLEFDWTAAAGGTTGVLTLPASQPNVEVVGAGLSADSLDGSLGKTKLDIDKSGIWLHVYYDKK